MAGQSEMDVLEKRIPKLLSRISDIADFRRIAADSLRGENDVFVSGLGGSARSLFIEGLWHAVRRPIIVITPHAVSYTHLRAHETPEHLVCRLLLEKKN